MSQSKVEGDSGLPSGDDPDDFEDADLFRAAVEPESDEPEFESDAVESEADEAEVDGDADDASEPAPEEDETTSTSEDDAAPVVAETLLPAGSADDVEVDGAGADEPEDETEPESQVADEAKSEDEAVAEAEPEPDAEANEPDDEPVAEAEPDAEAEPEPDAETDDEPGAEAGAEPDDEPDAEADEPDNEPVAEAAAETDDEPVAEAEPEPDAVPGAEPDAETDDEPIAEAEPERRTEGGDPLDRPTAWKQTAPPSLPPPLPPASPPVASPPATYPPTAYPPAASAPPAYPPPAYVPTEPPRSPGYQPSPSQDLARLPAGYSEPGTTTTVAPYVPDAAEVDLGTVEVYTPATDPWLRKRRRRRIRQQLTFVTLVLMVAGVGLAAYAAYLGHWTVPGTNQVASMPCPTQPVAMSHGLIKVNVYNGSSRHGLAGSAAKVMQQRDFVVPDIANDPQSARVKGVALVRYGPESSLQAKIVGAQLAGKVTFLKEPDRQDADIDLVVGEKFKDFKSVKDADKVTAPKPISEPEGCIPLKKK